MNHSFKKASVSHCRSQLGLTLIELMVSIVLGLVIVSGIIGVYLESKRNYASEEEIARIQENGRFTLNLLGRELMMAGFFGGTLKTGNVTSTAINSDCASGNWALDITDPIDFINHDFTSSLKTTLGTTLTCISSGEVQPNTDILTVKRTAGEPTLRLGEKVASLSASSSTEDQWYLQFTGYGDDIAWSKVSPKDIYDISSPDVGLAYWEAYTRIFYIRQYSETAGDGIPTLCEFSLIANDMTSRCLVEGIEEMHIEFGVDTDVDGIPDRYLASPSAAQMNSALVARVYLLVRSLQEVPGYQNTKSYQLGARAVAAKNDGFLRRVFSTTVQVRNAALPVG